MFTGSAVVGPASASIYTEDSPQALRAGWIDFWSTIKSKFPASLIITIPMVGETYESTTGEMTQLWSEGSTSVQNGTSGYPTHAKGVGARVIWETAGLTNGRRVRGSTYLIPLSVQCYETDGTIEAQILTDLRNAAADLVSAGDSNFVIWTRPKMGLGGKVQSVTGSTVPDAVSWLRSRRT